MAESECTTTVPYLPIYGEKIELEVEDEKRKLVTIHDEHRMKTFELVITVRIHTLHHRMISQQNVHLGTSWSVSQRGLRNEAEKLKTRFVTKRSAPGRRHNSTLFSHCSDSFNRQVIVNRQTVDKWRQMSPLLLHQSSSCVSRVLHLF